MPTKSSRAVAHVPSPKTLSADHKHLSALIIALVILCCVSFLVIYYKVDSDYANQSGDFNQLNNRLDTLEAKMDAARMEMTKSSTPTTQDKMMAPTNTTVPYTMPSPALPNNY